MRLTFPPPQKKSSIFRQSFLFNSIERGLFCAQEIKTQYLQEVFLLRVFFQSQEKFAYVIFFRMDYRAQSLKDEDRGSNILRTEPLNSFDADFHKFPRFLLRA